MMNAIICVALWLCAFLVTTTAAASDAPKGLLEWQSTNVQLLSGDDYELGRRHRQIATLEHANRWRFGDLHLFSDLTLNDDRGIYGEITPRFSLSRMGWVEAPGGLIKDTFVATQVELGKGGLRRYLAGVGLDLNLPGFTYFKINLFHRNNPELRGNTGQILVAWKRVVDLGPTQFVFEGFADFIGAEGGASANQMIVPRFLFDIGEPLGAPDAFYLGLEWQYWHNKFGRNGVTESVPQLQFKYQF